MSQPCSRKVSAFLWDVDGTIVDSRRFAYDATNDVLRSLGKRTYTADEFRELFSKDWRIHVKHMGIGSEKEVSYLVNTWNARLAADRHKFKLYDGILGILRYLHSRNYKMAIVSSSSRSQLQLYFNIFEIDKFFSLVISRENVDGQEPLGRPILQAVERLNVSPLNCVFIDDTKDGIKAARRLGAITIGVTWGFNSSKKITEAKPDFIADTPDSLYRVIAEKLGC